MWQSKSMNTNRCKELLNLEQSGTPVCSILHLARLGNHLRDSMARLMAYGAYAVWAHTFALRFQAACRHSIMAMNLLMTRSLTWYRSELKLKHWGLNGCISPHQEEQTMSHASRSNQPRPTLGVSIHTTLWFEWVISSILFLLASKVNEYSIAGERNDI